VQTVLLPCSAFNVVWQYLDHDGRHPVVLGETVESEFVERFQPVDEGLLIRDVREEDERTYICVAKTQHERHIRLFVPCESTLLVWSLRFAVFGNKSICRFISITRLCSRELGDVHDNDAAVANGDDIMIMKTTVEMTMQTRQHLQLYAKVSYIQH